MKKVLVLALLGVFLLSFMAPVFANEPKDKLSRGAANVFSALFEIPQNIDLE